MGGFTKIQLINRSQENIDFQNNKLNELKVAKKYRFYSENDIKKEYEYFKKEDGNYPEDLFPRDKIKTYKDFTNYWSPKALGEVFVPPIGTLTFDCYFGRTTNNAMKGIAKFLIKNLDQIEEVYGSYSTFVERCGLSKKDKELLLKMEETK